MGWLPLGELTPTINGWLQFPQPAIGGDLFRATFIYPPDRKTSSWVWIRSYFSNGEVTQSIRVYPHQESVIFELPIPPQLRAADQLVRYIGIRKGIPGRNGRWIDVSYTLSLEYSDLPFPATGGAGGENPTIESIPDGGEFLDGGET